MNDLTKRIAKTLEILDVKDAQVMYHDIAHEICKNCGHYYFLHLSNFKGECDACDSPEVSMDSKCPGFKL